MAGHHVGDPPPVSSGILGRPPWELALAGRALVVRTHNGRPPGHVVAGAPNCFEMPLD